MGSETDHGNPGFQSREIKSQNCPLKNTCGVEVARETPSLPGELSGETHPILECTQTHPPGNQHRKSPICLWVVEEVTESSQKAEQAAVFPFGPLPHIQYHHTAPWVAPTLANTYGSAPY